MGGGGSLVLYVLVWFDCCPFLAGVGSVSEDCVRSVM